MPRTPRAPTATPATEHARLPAEVLAAWELRAAELLADGRDRTFAVEAGGTRRALRLYDARASEPPRYAEDEVRSELAWLDHLAASGVLAPRAVAAADGRRVVAWTPPGASEPRCAALFTWVPGSPVAAAGAADYRRLGELMARLHRAAERFAPAEGFRRPAYDLDALLGAGDPLAGGLGEGMLSAAEARAVRQRAAEIRRRLAGDEGAAGRWGLVHGDLQITNYRFTEGRTGAIDFADFGWGWFLYDVACALLPAARSASFDELRDALLRGYRSLRPLPGAEQELPLMLDARAVFVLRWTLAHRHRPSVRDAALDIVAHAKAWLGRDGEAAASGGPVRLLAKLRARGIRLWEEDGALRFKAPEGAMTAELKGELKTRKQELIAFLAGQRRAAGEQGPPLAPVPRGEGGTLPLSFAQERLWILHRLDPASSVYNIAQGIELRGPLAAATLERALGRIVERHESLRTRLTTAGGEPVQVIDPRPRLPFARVDLGALGDAAEREARRLAVREAEIPFDLESGPPLRAVLLAIGEGHHQLLLDVHHAVSDGWSTGVMIRELAVLYAAFSQRRPDPQPPLAIQYGDFAVWQRRWLEAGELERQLAYWREQLAGLPELVELPRDRPRPAVRSGAGGRLPVELPAPVVGALEAIARRADASTFMVLAALFAELLRRLGAGDDLPIGTPVANRVRPELEPLIGFFVNSVVLRLRPRPEDSFERHVAAARRLALDGFAHQDLPFERLVEELAPRRDAGRAPLTQTFFALQNAPRPELELAGLTVRALPTAARSAKFDLALSFWPERAAAGEASPATDGGGGGLAGSVTYSAELYDRATIARWMEGFAELARAAAEDPSSPVERLPMLPAAQRRQLLDEWGSGGPAPAPATLPERFARAARAHAAAPAVSAGDETLSFERLEELATRLARGLAAAGVERGDRVALLMRRGVELPAAMLGVWAAGAATVPLDPALPAARLAFMLRDSARPGRAPLLLADAAMRGAAVAARGELAGEAEILAVDELMAAGGEGESEPAGAAPGDLAYLLYTSGTTGEPKAVAVTHANLGATLAAVDEAFAFRPGGVSPALASYAFDIFLFELFAPLVAGGSVRLVETLPTLDLEAVVAELPAWSSLHAVPALLRQLIGRMTAPAEGLEQLFVGGDRVPPELLAELGRFFPRAAVRVLYGPTEATILAAAWSVPADGAAPAAMIGRPLPGCRLRVVDAAGEPVAPGVPGELWIGGPGVAAGYLDRPELTAERFVERQGERFYRSGDLARWRSGGALEFLGRDDEQVKVRGFRVELGEVETALGAHPAVAQAAVVARPAEEGARLEAFVVAAAEAEPSVAELRAFLARRLPGYMVPETWALLAELPLTARDKVDRRRLLELGADGLGGATLDAGGEHVAPRSERERETAELFAAVLELDGETPPSVEASFFDLGGNSLSATRLLAQVRDRWGVEPSLAEFFNAPTAAALARQLDVVLQLREQAQAPPGGAADEDREEGEL